jgi:hypothetical protein
MTVMFVRVTPAYLSLLPQAAFRLICGAIVGWATITTVIFWRQAPIEYVAQRIIQGEPYKPEVINRQMPVIEAIEASTWCRPRAAQSVAIARLRLAEQSLGERVAEPAARKAMDALDDALRRSLVCAVADPLLWLVLDWAEDGKSSPEQRARYLDLSYRVGPNEGWIALKRSPIVLARYEELPSSLKDRAVEEFVGLVDSEFYRDAAAILAGPAKDLQPILIPRVAALAPRKRSAFAVALRDLGLEITIPAISHDSSGPH